MSIIMAAPSVAYRHPSPSASSSAGSPQLSPSLGTSSTPLLDDNSPPSIHTSLPQILFPPKDQQHFSQQHSSYSNNALQLVADGSDDPPVDCVPKTHHAYQPRKQSPLRQTTIMEDLPTPSDIRLREQSASGGSLLQKPGPLPSAPHAPPAPSLNSKPLVADTAMDTWPYMSDYTFELPRTPRIWEQSPLSSPWINGFHLPHYGPTLSVAPAVVFPDYDQVMGTGNSLGLSLSDLEDEADSDDDESVPELSSVSAPSETMDTDPAPSVVPPPPASPIPSTPTLLASPPLEAIKKRKRFDEDDVVSSTPASSTRPRRASPEDDDSDAHEYEPDDSDDDDDYNTAEPSSKRRRISNSRPRSAPSSKVGRKTVAKPRNKRPSKADGTFVCGYEDPITHEICGQGFRREYDKTRHENTIHAKHEKELVLAGHLKEEDAKFAHLLKNVSEIRCPKCDKKFSRQDALSRHLGSHKDI